MLAQLKAELEAASDAQNSFALKSGQDANQ